MRLTGPQEINTPANPMITAPTGNPTRGSTPELTHPTNPAHVRFSGGARPRRDQA